MLRQNLMVRLVKIVAEAASFPVNEVTETSTIEDLGLDSLDLVNIALDCEDDFGLDLQTEIFDGVKTVSAIADILMVEIEKNETNSKSSV